MFESIIKFFKKAKKDKSEPADSKSAAKERLHLVLMQDRANVSADFLDLMKQEIIDVIKKYIEVDENAIDVRLTNKENEDGTNGAPALYANIPILNIKNDARKVDSKETKDKKEKIKKEKIVENKNDNKEDKEEINSEEQVEKAIEIIQNDSDIEEQKVEENVVNETEKQEESDEIKIEENTDSTPENK